MTYDGKVVARFESKPVSMLFATPNDCVHELDLYLPDGKTLGELLDEGRARFKIWGNRHTVKIRKVIDYTRV